MKKVILITFLIFSITTKAQENQEEISKIETPKLVYILKGKMGFSQLHLFEYNDINGNVTQADFLLSSRLSNKFRLEYGFGASEFNGNTIFNNELAAVKNEYIKLPVNLVHNKEFNKNTSLIYGIGIYGNYLYNSKIPGYFEGKNVGLTIGGSIQIGANFKINDDIDFRIMFETQSDLSEINEQNLFKQKEARTSLFAFNIIYKL